MTKNYENDNFLLRLPCNKTLLFLKKFRPLQRCFIERAEEPAGKATQLKCGTVSCA